MLFTFPSRYWFAIGLLRVFSLGGWARRIHTGFLVSRATQEHGSCRQSVFEYETVTLSGRSFQNVLLTDYCALCCRSYNPARALLPERFGLFPVRSPLLGESLLFSLPTGTKMFQFPAFASRYVEMTGLQPAGLSHSEIRGSQFICNFPRLIAAYHVLHRL